MTREWHGGRALLNLPGFESTAAICAEIEDTTEWEPGKNGDDQDITSSYRATPDMKFSLANCDRSLDFQINIESFDDWENSDFKVGEMIRILTAFRKGLKVEHKRYMKRTAHLD